MRPLLLILLMLAGAALPASAGEADEATSTDKPVAVAPAPTEPPDEAADARPPHVILAERIGTPARPDVVRSIVAERSRDDVSANRTLAYILKHAGGTGAAEGLLTLLGSAHALVRRDALVGAATVGLRHAPLLARIRRAAKDDSDERVVLAACQALGSLGDGSDVPFLLSLMKSPERKLRVGAYLAMRTLSGLRVPNVHARWRHWWQERSARGGSAIRLAIASLEASELEPADRKRHADALLSESWLDLELVRKSLDEWLRGENQDLRRLACEVVGRWRLTEFAYAVEAAARGRWAREDLKEASAEALRLLGVHPK